MKRIARPLSVVGGREGGDEGEGERNGGLRNVMYSS